ncbi:MAG: hypothetical protein AVDCRST_MAG74-1501 [uncultured Pyrinomonadaceae bacterium]|uniref:Uncharacterized protein n=1 Tax=uncultured Pyrinomonadaceae bacterium TaxID=2283094 RepID=A0A6J4P1U8_9BACT|nr:MAG: hypothetical protein AVDCRST_MAG74-1501 [uncultured Pyrinomonadaceae bacterium]
MLRRQRIKLLLRRKTRSKPDKKINKFTHETRFSGAFAFAKRGLNILGLLCKVFKLYIFNFKKKKKRNLQ